MLAGGYALSTVGDATASKAVYLAKPDPASNDQRVAAIWNRNTGSNALEILIRWAAGNNYYRLRAQPANNILLEKQVAGVNTLLATYPWNWNQYPAVAVALQARGTDISASIAGVDQAPIVDASLAAGNWGIQYQGNQDILVTSGVSLQRFAGFTPIP